mmetsp:Transcript_13006/g.41203  ORF Transcript_13006/g.41203 Transcript_13006/m.41203 type:complete len:190 (+) Transcript_13006:98-667(+)
MVRVEKDAVAKTGPRDLTLHSSIGARGGEHLNKASKAHGLSAQQSALIQVYADEDVPFFGFSWTFATRELSLVLASTRDVHVYDSNVDVDLIVGFVVDYVVRDRATFPLKAKPNFGHDAVFASINDLDRWLKVHVRLMLKMNKLWTSLSDPAGAGPADGVRTATDDELRKRAALSSGWWQLTNLFYSDL